MSAPETMTPGRLRDMLQPAQEKQGYYFNADEALTLDILEQALINKERYGYMSCPCRLASGSREKDADILCPCRYREEDVKEFGSCYCGLYVAKGWNEGKMPKDVYVPDRRPAAAKRV